jgi:hypothetical protein
VNTREYDVRVERPDGRHVTNVRVFAEDHWGARRAAESLTWFAHGPDVRAAIVNVAAILDLKF